MQDHVEATDNEGRFQRLRGDAYVLAMGSVSPILAAPLGVRLPIYPAKGYSVTMPVKNPDMAHQISLTDANNHTLTFVYDDLNRLIQATDPLSGTVTYVYDRVGNPPQVINPLGHATTTHYDALNRPITVTNALSGTVGYTYDAVGNVLTVTDEEGQITEFS